MSARKLRLLAECLERRFMTDEDRHGRVNDLRGMAKRQEWAMAEAKEAEAAHE